MVCFLVCDSVTLTLLVLLLVILIYYVYNLRTNNVFRQRKIPGPPPIPFVGELYSVMRKGTNKNDIELINKYGKIVGIYEGMTPIVLVADLDLIRTITIKDANIFINRRTYDNFKSPYDNGLTLLKDEHWKNARTIVSPTFTAAKLKGMLSLMNDASDNYNKRLLEYADKNEIFDIKALDGQYTLDNITSCLFGIETNSLENENVALVQYLKKFSKISFKSLLFIVFLLSPRLADHLQKRGYSLFPMDSVDYITGMINQVLARRRQHLERRNDFIQIMVDHEEEVRNTEGDDKQEQQLSGTLKKTLNDEEIHGQAFVFFMAGFETTSILLSFFFYAMATEPAIQEKVREEIQREIGDDEITHENLQKLTYLDMVISETLRMYPPIFRFDRVASQDYKLDNYDIPKGTIINVPVYAIHHDPNIWPEPEKFIPERFTAEEKAKRHPMAFLAFGEGPRSCIGMRFALLEAKLAIAKAIRLVEFQTCEKTEIPPNLGKLVILSSKNGVWVHVVRRSQ